MASSSRTSIVSCKSRADVTLTPVLTHAHRPPPGEQALHERYSLVFFTRPNNSVRLAALKDESPIIADAVVRAPDHLRQVFEAGHTSYEWFTRRVAAMRTKNQNVRYLDCLVLIALTGLVPPPLGGRCLACWSWH